MEGPLIAIYSDFESINCKSLEPLTDKLSSLSYQKVIAAGLYIKSNLPEISSLYTFYVKDEVIKSFCNHVKNTFLNAIEAVKNKEVKTKDLVNVFFHNGTNYDFTFLIDEINETFKDCKISHYSKKNGKKYSIVIEKDGYKLFFKDSILFLNNKGIAKLSKCLDMEKKITKKHLDLKIEKSEYIEKQFFPYEWADSYEKLINEFPQREDFSNVMSGEISEKDYEHFCEVYSYFDCQHMLDYMLIYLRIDVGILADSMETLRKTCIEHFNIDIFSFNRYKDFILSTYLNYPVIPSDDLLVNVNSEIKDYSNPLIKENVYKLTLPTFTVKKLVKNFKINDELKTLLKKIEKTLKSFSNQTTIISLMYKGMFYGILKGIKKSNKDLYKTEKKKELIKLVKQHFKSFNICLEKSGRVSYIEGEVNKNPLPKCFRKIDLLVFYNDNLLAEKSDNKEIIIKWIFNAPNLTIKKLEENNFVLYSLMFYKNKMRVVKLESN